MATTRQCSPAEIECLKLAIIDGLRTGKRTLDVIRSCGIGHSVFHRMRRDDPAFDAAVVGARAKHELTGQALAVIGSEAASAVRSPETMRLKRLLLEAIESGAIPTKAAEDIGVSYATVRRWCSDDAEFGKDFDAAVQALTHVKLDELYDLHEEIPDAKLAAVAAKTRMFWLQMRNRKEFDREMQAVEGQVQVVSLLQAAINRLIDHVQPAIPVAAEPVAPPVIDIQPE